MKKLFFLLLLMSAIHVNAQDVIVMKDGNTIVSKILEITTNEVKYKKFTNLEGPTYTVLKSEVKVINYVNGEKETFEDVMTAPTNATGPVTSTKISDTSSQLQNLSYEQLLDMSNVSMVSSKKIKRLKRWGWIGGGVLAAAGVVLVVVGAPDVAGVNDPMSHHYDEGLALMVTGLGLVGAGVAWSTAFLVRANNLKKNGVLTINSAPIFQHEFSLKEGRSLMAGVDMLQDARMQNSRTVGFGLRYNF